MTDQHLQKPPTRREKTGNCKILSREFMCVKENLGDGNFGSVHMVKYLKTLMAVKVQEIGSKDDEERLLTELNLMKAGRENLFPKLLYSFQTELLQRNCQSKRFLATAMEYCLGSLEDFMSIKVEPIVGDRILVDIACAIKYMHDRRILHRDIKPDNILIGQDYCVRLSDFGLSSPIPEISAILKENGHTGLAGTPGYIAPEVFTHNFSCKKSDWWSFGVIAFEMWQDELMFHDGLLKGQPDVSSEWGCFWLPYLLSADNDGPSNFIIARIKKLVKPQAEFLASLFTHVKRRLDLSKFKVEDLSIFSHIPQFKGEAKKEYIPAARQHATLTLRPRVEANEEQRFPKLSSRIGETVLDYNDMRFDYNYTKHPAGFAQRSVFNGRFAKKRKGGSNFVRTSADKARISPAKNMKKVYHLRSVKQ